MKYVKSEEIVEHLKNIATLLKDTDDLDLIRRAVKSYELAIEKNKRYYNVFIEERREPNGE